MDTPDDEIIIEPEEEGVNPEERLKKLREKLALAVKEKQEYLDGWQRCRADFLNYKKRTDESLKGAREEGKAALIEDLLKAVESFEMAMGNKESWEKVDHNWRQGIEYIYRELLGALESHGLQKIDPKPGESFDPMVHSAVESIPTDEQKKDHTIAEVLQRGYMLNGTVLKHPRVKVWNIPHEHSESSP